MNKVVLVLTLIMLLGACSVTRGSRSYRNGSFSGGFIKQADGSNTGTIKLEDVSNSRLNTEVRLEVGHGSVCLELLDDRGQPTTSVISTPGKPALVKGYLIADAVGVVKYRITATEAENINYSLTIEPFGGEAQLFQD